MERLRKIASFIVGVLLSLPGYVPGGGMGGGPSPEDLAKKEKAEQEGKKKYGKDNGYPANVPFCAAFKEEERPIEETAKKKWCSDTKAKIPGLVKQCITNAKDSYAYNLSNVCKGQVSQTVSGAVAAWIFGGEVSTTTSCQLEQEARRDATLSRCESDGTDLERVINNQCNGY